MPDGLRVYVHEYIFATSMYIYKRCVVHAWIHICIFATRIYMYRDMSYLHGYTFATSMYICISRHVVRQRECVYVSQSGR